MTRYRDRRHKQNEKTCIYILFLSRSVPCVLSLAMSCLSSGDSATDTCIHQIIKASKRGCIHTYTHDDGDNFNQLYKSIIDDDTLEISPRIWTPSCSHASSSSARASRLSALYPSREDSAERRRPRPTLCTSLAPGPALDGPWLPGNTSEVEGFSGWRGGGVGSVAWAVVSDQSVGAHRAETVAEMARRWFPLRAHVRLSSFEYFRRW